MHFSSTLLLAGAISFVTATSLTRGQVSSRSALKKIMDRQFRLCEPVSTPSCSASCGEGFEVCISWPTCYDPTSGATCCSDGTYCRAGYYCTDTTCCPDGVSLAECGATRTLSVVPPPVASSTSSPSSSSEPSSSTTTTSTPGPTTYSTSEEPSTSSASTSSSSSSYAAPSPTPEEPTTTPEPTPIPLPTPVPSSNGTVTTAPPIQVTNAAGSVSVGAAQIAFGGVGALFLML